MNDIFVAENKQMNCKLCNKNNVNYVLFINQKTTIFNILSTFLCQAMNLHLRPSTFVSLYGFMSKSVTCSTGLRVV